MLLAVINAFISLLQTQFMAVQKKKSYTAAFEHPTHQWRNADHGIMNYFERSWRTKLKFHNKNNKKQLTYLGIPVHRMSLSSFRRIPAPVGSFIRVMAAWDHWWRTRRIQRSTMSDGDLQVRAMLTLCPRFLVLLVVIWTGSEAGVWTLEHLICRQNL